MAGRRLGPNVSRIPLPVKSPSWKGNYPSALNDTVFILVGKSVNPPLGRGAVFLHASRFRAGCGGLVSPLLVGGGGLVESPFCRSGGAWVLLLGWCLGYTFFPLALCTMKDVNKCDK